MRNIKSIYTKAHFGKQTFAQMPHKDIRNLYKNSISFFLIFNNGKNKEILLDKIKNRFL